MGQEAFERFPDPLLVAVLYRVFLGRRLDYSASAENLIGGTENLLGTLFRDCLTVAINSPL